LERRELISQAERNDGKFNQENFTALVIEMILIKE
jgi:hypothetical protein